VVGEAHSVGRSVAIRRSGTSSKPRQEPVALRWTTSDTLALLNCKRTTDVVATHRGVCDEFSKGVPCVTRYLARGSWTSGRAALA